jgi:hypothetical protein
MRDLSEKQLLKRIKAATKSFGANFYRHGIKGEPYTGNSEEEKDLRRRRQDYEKTKQQRP